MSPHARNAINPQKWFSTSIRLAALEWFVILTGFLCTKIQASVAQLAEQLICNQQVVGSSPSAGSICCEVCQGGFPSGQRGQTVNLMATPSQVRILFPPPRFLRVRAAAVTVSRAPRLPSGAAGEGARARLDSSRRPVYLRSPSASRAPCAVVAHRLL